MRRKALMMIYDLPNGKDDDWTVMEKIFDDFYDFPYLNNSFSVYWAIPYFYFSMM